MLDRAVARGDQRHSEKAGAYESVQAGPEGRLAVDDVGRPGATPERREPGRDDEPPQPSPAGQGRESEHRGLRAEVLVIRGEIGAETVGVLAPRGDEHEG